MQKPFTSPITQVVQDKLIATATQVGQQTYWHISHQTDELARRIVHGINAPCLEIIVSDRVLQRDNWHAVAEKAKGVGMYVRWAVCDERWIPSTLCKLKNDFKVTVCTATQYASFTWGGIQSPKNCHVLIAEKSKPEDVLQLIRDWLCSRLT